VLVLGLIVNVLLPAARRIGRSPLGEAPPAFALRYDLDRTGAWALAPASSRRARRRQRELRSAPSVPPRGRARRTHRAFAAPPPTSRT
jgi:hypothetical protein